MKFNKFINNYSNAILLLYKENSNQQLLSDLKLLLKIFTSYEQLFNILCLKIISKDEKKSIIESIFKKTITIDAKNILFVLIDQNIFFYLNDILRQAIIKINEISNIKLAKVETSFDLSETKKNQLIEALEKKYNCKIECEFILKKELIGGLVITIDDNKIDGSISSKLNLLRKTLISN